MDPRSHPHPAVADPLPPPLAASAVPMAPMASMAPVAPVGSVHRLPRGFRPAYRPAPPAPPAPAARVVHPRGFRVLKDTSAVERSMRSYFRLPPAPSPRLAGERRRVARALCAVDAREDEDAARFVDADAQPRVLLDGFLLLCAAGVEEPDAVTAVTLQSSRLVGAIEDDLAYFTGLRFLDVSENSMRVENLLRLTGLEVLHMAYNGIDSLAGIRRAAQAQVQAQLTSGSTEGLFNNTGNTSVRSAAVYYAQEQTKSSAHDKKMDVAKDYAEGHERVHGSRESFEMRNRQQSNRGYYSPHVRPVHCMAPMSDSSMHDVLLPHLHALNLSFNRIPPADIPHLSYFPFLEKLDLSGNGLRTLPEDLAELTGVTHLALEHNQLCDGAAVFAALSTMPALIEVNLNHNRLRRVPPLSIRDGRGLCFPTVEVIGLSHNRVRSAQDVAALSELVRTLQRIVLAGNPIARNSKERAAVQERFAQAVLSLYWEQAGARSSAYSHTQSNTSLKRSMGGTGANEKNTGMRPGEGNAKEMSLSEAWSATAGTLPEGAASMHVDDVQRWNQMIQVWRTQQQEQEQRLQQQQQQNSQSQIQNASYSGNQSTRPNKSGVSGKGAKGVVLSRAVSSNPSLWSRLHTELYDESDDFDEKSGMCDASIVNDLLESPGSLCYDEDVFLEAALDASALDISALDTTPRRDVFWYGDAEPLPVHANNSSPSSRNRPTYTASREDKRTPKDGEKYESSFPMLPSPSLLSFVDIVFEDVVMRKQPTGYFYANRRRLALESGDTEFSHVSWMIHPRTGFVTVPQYNEFMDIYKLFDKSQQPLRSGKRRKYNQGRQMPDILVPPEVVDEEEEKKEKEEEEEEEEDEEEEEEKDKNKCSETDKKVTPRDVVFMTGIALEDECNSSTEKPKKNRRPKPSVADNVKEKGVESEPPRARELKKPKMPEKSQKPQRPQMAAVDRPPDTNVRILMNELRSILRRPLPPLPAAAVRSFGKEKR